MRSDICVIGGGPAGLAAAIALAQSGREVTVLEASVPPIDKACGEGLLPDSLVALAKLGVTLDGVGAPLKGIRFIDGLSVATGDFTGGHFAGGQGRAVRRVSLHECLVDRAERLGVRLYWGVKNVQTTRGQVTSRHGQIKTKLIVGADGLKSLVRQQAGLQAAKFEKYRYGFRRHYGLKPWSPYVEVYWGDGFQAYVAPVSQDQVGVALLCCDPQLRLDAALRLVPALSEKLGQAPAVTREMGALSVSRKLRRVTADGYVLLGDASGSVDAITGEGLALAFQQSAALVEALNVEDLHSYQTEHESIGSRARQMSSLLLLLDRHSSLRHKVIGALAAHPSIFHSLLATHIGERSMLDLLSWQLVPFGVGVLSA